MVPQDEAELCVALRGKFQAARHAATAEKTVSFPSCKPTPPARLRDSARGPWAQRSPDLPLGGVPCPAAPQLPSLPFEG